MVAHPLKSVVLLIICEPKPTIFNPIIKPVQSAGHHEQMKGANMKTWMALSASTLILMTGCSSMNNQSENKPAPPQAEAALPSETALKRVWMLAGLEGFTREQLTALRAEMDLRSLPRGSAYMGCNRIMLNADSVTAQQISFGHAASTRMYCADRMALEQAFTANIKGSHTYRIEGHKLILRSESGKEMHFVAQDWD